MVVIGGVAFLAVGTWPDNVVCRAAVEKRRTQVGLAERYTIVGDSERSEAQQWFVGGDDIVVHEERRVIDLQHCVVGVHCCGLPRLRAGNESRHHMIVVRVSERRLDTKRGLKGLELDNSPCYDWPQLLRRMHLQGKSVVALCQYLLRPTTLASLDKIALRRLTRTLRGNVPPCPRRAACRSLGPRRRAARVGSQPLHTVRRPAMAARGKG